MRINKVIIVALFALSFMSSAAFADSSIKVLVNDEKVEMREPPLIMDGRTLVPLRPIFEALQIQPIWDGSTNTVTAKSGAVEMSLKIGSRVSIVNSKTVTLETPGELVNGNTMVPVRFISETFGATINWDSVTRTISIKTKQSSGSSGITNNSVENEISSTKSSNDSGYKTYIFPDGRFEGFVINGEYNGEGSYIFTDGSLYKGNFIDGHYNGQGTYTDSNGNVYVGTFKNDLSHGYGTYTYKDGSSYVGNFINGHYNGLGTHTDSNGNVYIGNYENDQPNGQGTYTLADGSSYAGTFKNGKKDGFGTAKFSSGSGYTGGFKDGKYSGRGTYFYGDGGFYSGIWENGDLIKCDQLPDN